MLRIQAESIARIPPEDIAKNAAAAVKKAIVVSRLGYHKQHKHSTPPPPVRIRCNKNVKRIMADEDEQPIAKCCNNM